MKKQKYDERQIMIQNKITAYLFTGLAVLVLLNAFLRNIGIKWAESELYSYCIIIETVTIPGYFIMLFKDAYMTSFKSRIICSLFFCIISLITMILSIDNIFSGCPVCEKIISNGSLTSSGSLLISAILLLIFGLGGFVKILFDKLKKEEENRAETEPY